MKKFRKLAWDTVLLTKIQNLLKLKKKKDTEKQSTSIEYMPKASNWKCRHTIIPKPGISKTIMNTLYFGCQDEMAHKKKRIN